MRAPLSSSVITVKVIELQKSLLEVSNFFSRFLNTLTADDKYSLISKDNFMQSILRLLSQNQNVFSQFFSSFFEFTLNLERSQKRMTLTAYVFPKLPTMKDVLR